MRSQHRALSGGRGAARARSVPDLPGPGRTATPRARSGRSSACRPGDLARGLGVSVGKLNYCLRALVDKGFVKVNNFRQSDNKLAYAYLLTPRGIEEKARVTVAFLQYKLAEYAQIERDIAELRAEAARLDGAAIEAGTRQEAA